MKRIFPGFYQKHRRLARTHLRQCAALIQAATHLSGAQRHRAVAALYRLHRRHLARLAREARAERKEAA